MATSTLPHAPLLVTPRRAAELLGVSVRSLDRLVEAGRRVGVPVRVAVSHHRE